MNRVLTVAVAIAVLGAAVAVLARFTVWFNRIAIRTRDFLDDWNGEEARPGVLRRPGVPERLMGIESRLGRVEAELKPDGGATMRDALDRVESAVGGGEPGGPG